jgi:hypothetical protein
LTCGAIGCGGLFFLFILGWLLPNKPALEPKPSPKPVPRAASKTKPRTAPESSSEIVTQFFEKHPEYGTVKAIEEAPDWAEGTRKEVTTRALVHYLVYVHTKRRAVVGVWRLFADGHREQLYHQ